MKRKEFLKSTGMMLASGITLGLIDTQELKAAVATPTADPAAGAGAGATQSPKPFPLHDLHLHVSPNLSPEQMIEQARATGTNPIGILMNMGLNPEVYNDQRLEKFIADHGNLPCLIGLQPMEIGWSANLSKELLDKIDYVVMDPQTIRNSNRYGDTANVWMFDCYVPDVEDFMDLNVEHYIKVINNPEPLDIFGWPLYLPPAIAREYYRVWTVERMERIIEAVRARGLALEINDLARTPHTEFILMAKKAGVKFAFGSDTRDHRAFRLDYCKQIASLCGLTYDDFYIPVRKNR